MGNLYWSRLKILKSMETSSQFRLSSSSHLFQAGFDTSVSSLMIASLWCSATVEVA